MAFDHALSIRRQVQILQAQSAALAGKIHARYAMPRADILPPPPMIVASAMVSAP